VFALYDHAEYDRMELLGLVSIFTASLAVAFGLFKNQGRAVAYFCN
jgi:hypothetical protein